jgi:hypothetical protein
MRLTPNLVQNEKRKRWTELQPCASYSNPTHVFRFQETWEVSSWSATTWRSRAPSLYCGEWSASHPGLSTPVDRASGTHWIGGWVGHRAGLEAVRNRTPFPWLSAPPPPHYFLALPLAAAATGSGSLVAWERVPNVPSFVSDVTLWHLSQPQVVTEFVTDFSIRTRNMTRNMFLNVSTNNAVFIFKVIVFVEALIRIWQWAVHRMWGPDWRKRGAADRQVSSTWLVEKGDEKCLGDPRTLNSSCGHLRTRMGPIMLLPV